jgi:CHAD domain-containing protein
MSSTEQRTSSKPVETWAQLDAEAGMGAHRSSAKPKRNGKDQPAGDKAEDQEGDQKHKLDQGLVDQPRSVSDAGRQASKSKGSGFALRPGVSFRKDVARIVRRQLDKALRDLCRLGATADEAIHDVRKRFKRVRAVLRLIRGELGDRLYREENKTLRDAAAAFSEVRNSRVLVDAVEKLRHRESDVPTAAFDALERFLKARQSDIHDRLARNVEAMDELREAIEHGRSRAADWPLPRDGRRVLRRGLRRTFKHGARALDDAEKARTSEHLHQCRKQIKYLYHQVQMLERVASPSVTKLEEQLHELEQKLGDDHDLGMLRVEVVACVAAGLPEVNDRLVALIDDWRRELQEECLRKAQKIYREDSPALRHRFRDCSKQLSSK